MRNALNVPNTRCGLRKYEMAICTDFLGNQNLVRNIIIATIFRFPRDWNLGQLDYTL